MNDERDWKDEAEEALERTTEALRAAWDSSREARMSALAAARDAANLLGKAIDEGVAVARRTWESDDDGESTEVTGDESMPAAEEAAEDLTADAAAEGVQDPAQT